jgi:chemotaxis protein methyltransferase CheR
VVRLAPEQFARLRDLLSNYSGVYLDATRQRLLEHGIGQRLLATGDGLLSYELRLRAPGARDELCRLSELVLNHETVFFRNMPHVRALRDVLLPELHRRKPRGEAIRIWSAGCATGEEAYSLAITVLEAFGGAPARPVEIWATDLSAPALDKARDGLYRGRTLHNLPPELLKRYFQPSGAGYLVGAAARALVRFEQINLLDPFPPDSAGIDLIFCQNVTIYFQVPTCRSLIARFYACLPEGGLLLLGFSETLWNIFDKFHMREVGGAYVYYKGALESPAQPPNIATHIYSGPLQVSPNHSGRRQAQPRRPRNGRSGGPSVTPDRSGVFHDHAGSKYDQADDALLAQGRALLAQGQIEQTLEMVGRIPPQSDRAPQALTLAARAHADRGDIELALVEVQRVIDIDQLNEEAYLLLGIIYGRQQQWPAAIQQFERARYLSADSALVSFHLAEAYRQAGYVEKAAREYRVALRKLEPHPPGAILDGVAVEWLRETCERQRASLARQR